MMVSLSIFLNLRYRSPSTTEDEFNRAAAWLALIFYTILFPIAVTFVTYKYNYLWFQQDFSRRFDSLTLGLYVNSKMSAIMYGLIMFRQLAIILVAVLSDFSLLQITLALYI